MRDRDGSQDSELEDKSNSLERRDALEVIIILTLQPNQIFGRTLDDNNVSEILLPCLAYLVYMWSLAPCS